MDIDEIAALFAVAKAARTGKEAHLAGFLHLFREVVNDRGHAPLVLLARPVDVEITEADGSHRDPVQSELMAKVVVEDQLGIAVDIQRALIFDGGREVPWAG